MHIERWCFWLADGIDIIIFVVSVHWIRDIQAYIYVYDSAAIIIGTRDGGLK